MRPDSDTIKKFRGSAVIVSSVSLVMPSLQTGGSRLGVSLSRGVYDGADAKQVMLGVQYSRLCYG